MLVTMLATFFFVGTGDGSPIVFPEKQIAVSKAPISPSPTSVPTLSPNAQELLRQQELQLRILQEQVSVTA